MFVCQILHAVFKHRKEIMFKAMVNKVLHEISGWYLLFACRSEGILLYMRGMHSITDNFRQTNRLDAT